MLLEDFVGEVESVVPVGGVFGECPGDVVGVVFGDKGFGKGFQDGRKAGSVG